MKGLGNALATLRKQRGISQQQLAEIAATTQGHVSKIENDAYNPSVDLLSRIADVLSCELEIRLRPKEEPQASPSSSAALRPARGSPDNIRYLGDDVIVLLSLAREKIKAQAANLTPDERLVVGQLLSLCLRHLDGDEEQLKEG